jgi:archaellum biogenesis ATPase FlaH
MKTESVIFGNLIENEDYARKVIPFLQEEYFTDPVDKKVFTLIKDYVDKYNTFPTKSALILDLKDVTGLSEDQYKTANDTINGLEKSEDRDLSWLIDHTEKFCKDKALYNALMKSIQIVDDNNKDSISVGAIPQILTNALGVSFDTHIGHDFLDDAADRYEFYHRKEVRTSFDLDHFNKITQGGLPRKTLNIALAGTGVGKSLFMCHNAAHNLMSGCNVLYITMEMAEERIAERIDANLIGVTLDELKDLPQSIYYKLIGKVKKQAKGKLIVKEYPTACAGSANFRHLLNELKIKKNFVPDVIYIDYLNICASSRIKPSSNVNSYTYIKAVAEELRGLAVEFNVPVISATQTNRTGFSNSDVGLEDTSESFGLPATADFMFALITSDELRQLNQIMVKQLKNRYGDPAKNKRFVIGVDYSKMRLYNVEASAQEDIQDDVPIFSMTSSGNRLENESKPATTFDKLKFAGFK